MLSDSQKKNLKALISMLDEPDEKIFNTLRNQVLSYKYEAYPILQDAWMAANDLLVTGRLEHLMEEVNFRFISVKFTKWLSEKNDDILEPLLLINRLGVPDIDTNKVRKEVETLIKDTWLEINNGLTALEKIKVMNHIFYVVHQYHTPHVADDAVPPFYLSYVTENKTGNPSSLGLLYLFVAQILEIPLLGVNLPGHLILAYVEENARLNKKDFTASDIFFYINPFNKGAVFTRSEIDLYVKQLKIEPKEQYYSPSANKIIIERYIKELEKAYRLHNKPLKQEQIKKILELFSKTTF